jgi:hypothetical protein
VADEPTGLEYFKQSDAWKDTQVADWDMIDFYVEQGKLTPEERDLLHAYGSMVYLNPSSSSGDFPEVNAAWTKYLELDDTEATLDTYDEVTYGGPSMDDPPPFDNKDIKSPPDVPPGSDVPPGGTIAVSTDAMNTFIERIGMLNEPMTNSANLLKGVKIEPGGFAEAWALESKIEAAETGLVPATSLFIGKVRNNLLLVTDACDALIKEYTNSEELNQLTGEKLNTFVGQLKTGLTDMGGPGATPPPA